MGRESRCCMDGKESPKRRKESCGLKGQAKFRGMGKENHGKIGRW